jgi:hypothetical protein
MNPLTWNIYWFLLPLVVAISLVYAASRHETWPRIGAHALRVGLTIVVILAVTTGLLFCINTFFV